MSLGHCSEKGGPPGGGPPVDGPPVAAPIDDNIPAGTLINYLVSNFTETLNKAIDAMAPKESKARTKAREPDLFDGSSPNKLRSWKASLVINFLDQEQAFQTKESKVIYAFSYLRGTALAWFKLNLLTSTGDCAPAWTTSFTAFVQELQDNFGPADPIGQAEAAIKSLEMRPSERVTSYIVKFNTYAVQIQWGDAALRSQFYDGLPDRLKDEISRVGKPDSVLQMRRLAQSFDARHWERQEELARK